MDERVAMSDVIVLLPGITGSVLKNGDGRVVWGYSAGTIGKALFSGAANIRRELALPHDDWQVDDLDDGIHASDLMPDLHLLPGLWKIDGYGAIVDMLLAGFKLTEGQNFFRFPYDWRRDNRVAARKLARASHDWLRAWRERGHPNAKLILLAHSMGGLVSRYFLENMEGWKDTRALITFGTPFRGSLNSLDNLANGMKKGPLDLTPLVRQFTSVYQLLPVFKCWDDGSGRLARVGEVSGIPNVDPARAADALAFHRSIESAVTTNHALDGFKAGGYQLYPVVGLAQRTCLSATANGRDGLTLSELSPLDDSQVLGGDGTVPRVAAVPAEVTGPAVAAMYAATKHGSLQNADAVLAHLSGVLSGTSIDLGGFLKPKVQVALEVDDLVAAGSPVSVRLRPVRADASFEVVLRGPAGEQRAAARAGRDGWFEAAFAPPAPGVYRVNVVGPQIETAEDSFVVATAEA